MLIVVFEGLHIRNNMWNSKCNLYSICY